jgi:hypothetical protein
MIYEDVLGKLAQPEDKLPRERREIVRQEVLPVLGDEAQRRQGLHNDFSERCKSVRADGTLLYYPGIHEARQMLGGLLSRRGEPLRELRQPEVASLYLGEELHSVIARQREQEFA